MPVYSFFPNDVKEQGSLIQRSDGREENILDREIRVPSAPIRKQKRSRSIRGEKLDCSISTNRLLAMSQNFGSF